jgi:hypothetical protein
VIAATIAAFCSAGAFDCPPRGRPAQEGDRSVGSLHQATPPERISTSSRESEVEGHDTQDQHTDHVGLRDDPIGLQIGFYRATTATTVAGGNTADRLDACSRRIHPASNVWPA